MTTSHSVLSESNHPDAIERELSWLLKVDPLWRSDTSVDCVPLKKICNGSITEIANNLSKGDTKVTQRHSITPCVKLS